MQKIINSLKEKLGKTSIVAIDPTAPRASEEQKLEVLEQAFFARVA